MSNREPIIALQQKGKNNSSANSKNHCYFQPLRTQISFDRNELNTILSVYGRHVATGEWRDYAIDFGHERAVFSIFRRASECPLYRVEKDPKLARKQGAFSITDQSGRILKRGHELGQVLKIFDKKPRLAIV